MKVQRRERTPTANGPVFQSASGSVDFRYRSLGAPIVRARVPSGERVQCVSKPDRDGTTIPARSLSTECLRWT